MYICCVYVHRHVMLFEVQCSLFWVCVCLPVCKLGTCAAPCRLLEKELEGLLFNNLRKHVCVTGHASALSPTRSIPPFRGGEVKKKGGWSGGWGEQSCDPTCGVVILSASPCMQSVQMLPFSPLLLRQTPVCVALEASARGALRMENILAAAFFDVWDVVGAAALHEYQHFFSVI